MLRYSPMTSIEMLKDWRILIFLWFRNYWIKDLINNQDQTKMSKRLLTSMLKMVSLDYREYNSIQCIICVCVYGILNRIFPFLFFIKVTKLFSWIWQSCPRSYSNPIKCSSPFFELVTVIHPYTLIIADCWFELGIRTIERGMTFRFSLSKLYKLDLKWIFYYILRFPFQG